MSANRAKNSDSTRVAEMVPVKDLLPWVKNPRKNDHAVKKVAESIRRFGFASPIIARRENGEVTCSNGIWLDFFVSVAIRVPG